MGVKTADIFDKSGAGDCSGLAAKEFAVGRVVYEFGQMALERPGGLNNLGDVVLLAVPADKRKGGRGTMEDGRAWVYDFYGDGFRCGLVGLGHVEDSLELVAEVVGGPV